MANPRVRPHLSFFPEDTGKSVNEYRQAAHWRTEADPALLTPVAFIQNQQFFVFEPCILQDSRACIPVRWFIRNKKVFAQAWVLRAVSRDDGSGWIVEEHNQIEVSQDEFLISFERWDASQLTSSLPHSSCLLGKLTHILPNAASSYSMKVVRKCPMDCCHLGLEQILRLVIAGRPLQRGPASILSRFGFTVTIHLATSQRNGTSIIHSCSLQPVSHVLTRIKSTMFTSSAHQTQHHLLRC